MKRIITIFILIFTVSASSQTKKAIFVIVDGIAADVIESQPTPHLHAISTEGGYTRAHAGGEKGGYTETPTISAVGYNSLLTGTWVNKHNVWDNDIKEPNYHYWTLFRFFKEQFPEGKTAVFSSWTDNRTKLIGEGLPETGNLRLTHHVDGLELDTVRFPHDAKKDYMHRIDETVVDSAADYIRKQAPDLSWVYLEYTDDMGHAHGDSPEFYRAVGLMDAQIGRLWEAIQFRQQRFNEDWVIYITTDHGRDAKTGKGHGGQSDRERSTWIVTNAKDLNEHFKTGNPGIVDIMPSIARHLGIRIPREQMMEIDGIPLTGPLAIKHPSIEILDNGQFKIGWVPQTQQGDVKIWLTTTNNFNKGQPDKYSLMSTTSIIAGQVIITPGDNPFYKIVLEAKENSVNRWISK